MTEPQPPIPAEELTQTEIDAIHKEACEKFPESSKEDLMMVANTLGLKEVERIGFELGLKRHGFIIGASRQLRKAKAEHSHLQGRIAELEADLIVAHSAIQTHLRHKEDLQNDLQAANNKLKALETADNIMLSEKDKKIENLKSVMVAAAEEIQEHWAAHCDGEGYGPSNLMHRLKKGLAAEYCGYKPGAFLEMAKELSEARGRIERLEAALREVKNNIESKQSSISGKNEWERGKYDGMEYCALVVDQAIASVVPEPPNI